MGPLLSTVSTALRISHEKSSYRSSTELSPRTPNTLRAYFANCSSASNGLFEHTLRRGVQPRLACLTTHLCAGLLRSVLILRHPDRGPSRCRSPIVPRTFPRAVRGRGDDGTGHSVRPIICQGSHGETPPLRSSARSFIKYPRIPVDYPGVPSRKTYLSV